MVMMYILSYPYIIIILDILHLVKHLPDVSEKFFEWRRDARNVVCEAKAWPKEYNYNYVTIREEIIPIMITLAVTVDNSTITTNINTSKRAPR